MEARVRCNCRFASLILRGCSVNFIPGAVLVYNYHSIQTHNHPKKERIKE